MNNIFQPKRFIRMFIRDLAENARTLVISLAVLMAVSLTVSLLTVWGSKNDMVFTSGAFYLSMQTAYMFVMGLIFSAGLFKEIHRKDRNIFYFSLPASSLEKFLSKYLIAVVVLPVLYMLVYPLFSYVEIGLQQLIFRRHMIPLNPFNDLSWMAFGIFFVFQTFFICGSVVFTKRAFLKTILSMFIFNMCFSLSVGLIGFLFFPKVFIKGFHMELDLDPTIFLNFNLNRWMVLGKIVIYGIVPLFFLALSYVKFTEKEVTRGV